MLQKNLKKKSKCSLTFQFSLIIFYQCREPSPDSLVSRISCPVSCLPSPVRRLMSLASFFPSPVSCLPSHVYCLMSPVSCLLSTVSCLPSPCFPSPVSCVLFPVYCLTSSVSCPLSPVSCLPCCNCCRYNLQYNHLADLAILWSKFADLRT